KTISFDLFVLLSHRYIGAYDENSFEFIDYTPQIIEEYFSKHISEILAFTSEKKIAVISNFLRINKKIIFKLVGYSDFYKFFGQIYKYIDFNLVDDSK